MQIVSKNKKLCKIIKSATQAARFPVSVLITGESGVGKEVLARFIHTQSSSIKNTDDPFVAINCLAVPENLLESELFGYEKGAFSGASHARPGLIRSAKNGSLLLDEIGDMPIGLQGKLLRCLETKTVTPVGSVKPVVFSARIIAATNKNIVDLVDKGEFREDLYHRLNTIELDIPPLRERPEDISFLFDDIMEDTLNKFELNENNIVINDNVYRQISQLEWKGNVRELKNFIKRLLIHCYVEDDVDIHITTKSVIDVLSPDVKYNESIGATFKWDIDIDGESLEEARAKLETVMIKALIDKYGSIAKAARVANVSYPSATKYANRGV